MVHMGYAELFIGPDSRECGTCRQVKPYHRFTPRGERGGTTLYKSTCKECCAAGMRKWAKDNPERHAATRHARELRETYGISVERYQEMLEEQEHKCAICKSSEDRVHGTNGTTFRLSVDHCHETGRVRGLLCNTCNRAIGLLKDRVDLLESAIDYLTKGSGSN